MHQGQRGARIKPGDPEEYLGKSNPSPPGPGQGAPALFGAPWRVLPVALPRPGWAVTSDPFLSFTSDGPAPNGRPGQAYFSPWVPWHGSQRRAHQGSRPGGRKGGLGLYSKHTHTLLYTSYTLTPTYARFCPPRLINTHTNHLRRLTRVRARTYPPESTHSRSQK